MNHVDSKRLHRELALLGLGSVKYQIPALPVAQQLLADAERPLPDTLPPRPAWLEFQWPESGYVSWNNDRKYGGRVRSVWEGERL